MDGRGDPEPQAASSDSEGKRAVHTTTWNIATRDSQRASVDIPWKGERRFDSAS